MIVENLKCSVLEEDALCFPDLHFLHKKMGRLGSSHLKTRIHHVVSHNNKVLRGIYMGSLNGQQNVWIFILHSKRLMLQVYTFTTYLCHNMHNMADMIYEL